MSLVNINDFLNSLAIYMVTAAAAQSPATSINYLTVPRGLWLNKIAWPDAQNANAQQPADPVTVLRIYGGVPNFNESKLIRAVQCMTTTISNEAAALQQAEALHQTLLNPLNATGVPLRPQDGLVIPNWEYPSAATQNGNWKIVSLLVKQPPGKIGVDPQNLRPLIVFNFDVGFVPDGQS